MAEVKGKMITCNRDSNFVFLKRLVDGDTDGGFTKYERYEDLPSDWMFATQFGYLCPKCAREFRTFMTTFFNGNVVSYWKNEEGETK